MRLPWAHGMGNRVAAVFYVMHALICIHGMGNRVAAVFYVMHAWICIHALHYTVVGSVFPSEHSISAATEFCCGSGRLALQLSCGFLLLSQHQQRIATSAHHRSTARKSEGSSIFLPISKEGRPRYGQPAQRKASPSPHCRQQNKRGGSTRGMWGKEVQKKAIL